MNFAITLAQVQKNIHIIECSERHMQLIIFCCTFLLCAYTHYCYGRDTLSSNTLVSDEQQESLVSNGEIFELGFFTPEGSNDYRRYVGIWYYKSNPRTVVWVANRDNPLSDSSGVFALAEDGNLKVLDGNGESHWKTNLEDISAVGVTVKLMDSGNLAIISKEENQNQSARILWESFSNPTDTFLPGMKMDDNLVLSSWKSEGDPATGNFTFQLDQGGGRFVIWRRSMRYWQSGVSDKLISSDGMPSGILYLLSNFSSSIVHNNSVPYLTSSLYGNTRLLISFSGQAEYLKWDNEKVWSLVWAEPRDRCSLYNACGNFGSCNSRSEPMCKCLPGFHPSLPGNWNGGDFSGGCSRKSTLCSKKPWSETFLSLKQMKVGNPDSQFNAKSETECRTECLNNCQCQAYSYEEANTTRRDVSTGVACWIWNQDLNNIQEEYDNGRNLYVQVATSDIESTTRTCETCGTNSIPYPLSTGPTCGDPAYSYFHCDNDTSKISFVSQGTVYAVTYINQETRKFIIQIKDANNCETRTSGGSMLQLNKYTPFHVTDWCSAPPKGQESDLTLHNGNEVEVSWKPPAEPLCSSFSDCKDWPNSTCNTTADGKKRCLCNKHFQWDGLRLNCTQGIDHSHHAEGFRKGTIELPLIIALTSASVIVLLISSCASIIIYLQRKKDTKRQEIPSNIASTKNNSKKQEQLRYKGERSLKELIDSGRYNEDDKKGLDVPFFEFESILAATDYFSNSNKLGQGGFGAVYKGNFDGGQEIAVKRLSSCSGQGFEEFENEVVLIAKLQHRNLVRLLGYCVQGEEKILLYEYMPNRSLDSFIFDQKLCVLLDWGMRFNIILGVARGLIYLHQDSRLRIIHRDLKTSNILVDEEMNPKISDFGLARIFGGKETGANTKRVVGTYGYMSPEYALDGFFSVKSDVFSFGVVVLEIVSGNRNSAFYHSDQGLSLLGYAWNLWKEDKAFDFLDQSLKKSCITSEFLKCVNVGLLCVQEDPNDRPTMANVVFMLGSETATLPTPKQPAFIVRRCPSSRASSSSKPETISQNELTMTLVDGR